MSLIKPYLRWIILGLTLFFITKTVKTNWQTVTSVTLDSQGWTLLSLALIITLIAHIWSGFVWLLILKGFKQPVSILWALKIYLITNIAKYLPGNVGHFYGRISAVSKKGASLAVASLSVLLEPLLMASAALLIALSSHFIGVIKTTSNFYVLTLQIFSLLIILLSIHPFFFNKLITFTQKNKRNKNKKNDPLHIDKYPSIYLLGEIIFLLLRGLGFILVLMAFMSISIKQIPVLLSAFSFAWLLGLVIPGAPGGIGVFEATIIALLQQSTIPIGIILTPIAIFRIISILAEVIAAGLGLLL
ncbi:lysylphosphatidylglycerol synthase domain-containing protein [Aphanothece sacrum]|uniref:Transmembrane protein HieC n=1 Tax=Aphanothece sacrum FPU1 TaxID=1920663 RepID=A0A401IDI4_APHSA|nr:lysylphosphatidylglycerol synthase domain-containing protein [Aphanothece sacrum]GBF79363.1 transmembrane protein HieC [Aphanothece sacrum FPU1]GBF86864.1 transmembrane protein [Aphanothece sacrum FPU3]